MSSNARRNQPALAVEELESRQLLSVTVTPGRINQKSITNGNGAFHVRVISDTDEAKAALSAGTPLVLTLTDQAGNTATLDKAVRVVTADFNHDGVLDQLLKFRRKDLKDLEGGDVTVALGSTDPSSTTTTTQPDTGTFTIFVPGGKRKGSDDTGGTDQSQEGTEHGHGHTSGSHGKHHGNDG